MFLLVLGIGLLTYYLYKHFVLKRQGLPPGPTPLPVVGNLLSMDDKNPAEQLNKWANERGG